MENRIINYWFGFILVMMPIFVTAQTVENYYEVNQEVQIGNSSTFYVQITGVPSGAVITNVEAKFEYIAYGVVQNYVSARFNKGSDPGSSGGGVLVSQGSLPAGNPGTFGYIAFSNWNGQTNINTNYYFRFSVASGSPYTCTIKKLYVKITYSQPSLTVTSPNGGETWYKGSDYAITWNSTNVTGNIQIDLYKNSENILQLGASAENTGSYPFNPPAYLVSGSDYKIGISAMGGNVSDFSNNYFTITTQPSANLDVTSPNGGETWYKGSDYTITWNSTNVTGNIQIDLYKNGENILQLGASAENTGSYPFNPPAYLVNGSDYKIGISAMGGNVSDFSNNYFTITSQPSANLEVTSPNGGETWFKDNDYTITWDSENVTGNIQIDLYKNGENILQLGASAENTGSYPFNPPSYLVNGSDYKIGISAMDGNVSDFSNNYFTIQSQENLSFGKIPFGAPHPINKVFYENPVGSNTFVHPWFQAATCFNISNNGYVEIEYAKVIQMDNLGITTILQSIDYDESGSLNDTEGRLYLRNFEDNDFFFFENEWTNMSNSNQNGGVLRIDVGEFPDYVSHWWVERFMGNVNYKYFVEVKMKIVGDIGVQIGCDYYQNMNDNEGVLEAWVSDWYGNTNGEFITVTIPNYTLPTFDCNDYGFTAEGVFYFSETLIDHANSENIQLGGSFNNWTSLVDLSYLNGYYIYNHGQTLNNIESYYLKGLYDCNNTYYLPDLIKESITPDDLTPNGQDGYNFETYSQTSIGCIGNNDNCLENINNDYPYVSYTGTDCGDSENLESDVWGFYRYQCTSWAAYKINNNLSISFANSMFGGNGNSSDCSPTNSNERFSNACRWDDIFSLNGVLVDNIPANGAIAHWDAFENGVGQYGHVGFVECIDGDFVTISNYNGWNANISTPCNFGILTIDNSAPYSITNKKPGRYIHVENGGFGGTTNLNQGEQLNSECFYAFPNPTDKYVYFNFCDSMHIPHKLLIINSFGQIVSEKPISDINTTVDISNFTQGLYVFVLQYENYFKTIRIVKIE